MSEVLLQVENLVKHFPVGGGMFSKPAGQVRAIDGVSFTLHRGETLGLVGESGCGKTTTGRCILQLERPTSGRILFEGVDLATVSEAELRKVRRRVQVIFQDPYSSLNPRMTIGQIIAEPLKVHGIVQEAAARERRVQELLEQVGLLAQHARRYPHQLSGGQRQRVGIARALSLRPEMIVADEPVSALDVSIRAQILNLLAGLKEKLDLTLLFISHDLAAVEWLCDRVLVMNAGRIIEDLPSERLATDAKEELTRRLIACRSGVQNIARNPTVGIT